MKFVSKLVQQAGLVLNAADVKFLAEFYACCVRICGISFKFKSTNVRQI